MRTEVHRLFRFAVAGVIGYLVDAGGLLLVIGVLGPYWGRALSFSAAVLVTWLVNRRYAFADRVSGQGIGTEFASYLSAMLVGGALNYAVYAAGIGLFGSSGAIPYIAVAAGSLAGMVVNLALARLFIFRHERDGR